MTQYTHLSNSCKTVILILIPSHIGIRGNERAVEAAKSTINLNVSAVKCPATDLYPDVVNHFPASLAGREGRMYLKQTTVCQTSARL